MLFGCTVDRTHQIDRDTFDNYVNGLAGQYLSDTDAVHIDRTAGLFAPSIHIEDGLAVALTGDPTLDPDDQTESGTNSVARAIAAVYRARGSEFLQQLQGSFSLAVIDRNSGTALLAVDRLGVERLAYAKTADGVAFSSSASVVADFPDSSSSLRAQALFDYLLLHMVPSPDSAYSGVSKLRPGTFVRYARGQLTVERYWRPEFVESGRSNARELANEIREGLRDGVKASRPGPETGAFLSGGLDSSSVAGMLCDVLGAPASTFSIGFGIDAFNELDYARLANQRFGCLGHEYEVTADDIVTAFPNIASAYDEPFGNSSAVPTYFCARLANQHGISHLLAGDGGDEIFGGNERYARQRVFELYGAVPRFLRSQLIEPLTRAISPESRLVPLRKLRSYVDQARIRLPERLETWNFMYRADLGEMLHDNFAQSIDPRAPFRRMAEVYDSAPAKSLVNRMLFYDWHYTLADNDLRKVRTMCEMAGVRVSFPMLHKRLVEVALRIPPRLKVSGLNLRVLYKEAMAGFLPREIIHKNKHGFGLPFGHWLKTHAALADMIYSYLDDLKGRQIVKADFLDRLIQDHKSGHPSYFGYAIWDLAMLEAWLKAHAVSL